MLRVAFNRVWNISYRIWQFFTSVDDIGLKITISHFFHAACIGMRLAPILVDSPTPPPILTMLAKNNRRDD